MFTTFIGVPSGAADGGSPQPNAPDGPGQKNRASTNATGVRSKRSQVSRACDWCRLNRIKCDSEQPCHNCRSRGGECSSNGRGSLRSLPSAAKEIERLRAHIKRLEERLNEQSNGSKPSKTSKPFLPSPSASSDGFDPMEEHKGNLKHWENIMITNTQTHVPQLYGMSSSAYFLARLNGHFARTLQRPHLDQRLQPYVASEFFSSPPSPSSNGSKAASPTMENYGVVEDLSRAQEEYFLGLFWQTYHCSLPILDEQEFREQYNSLWMSTSPLEKPSRKASPLVDIVIALCMQYGMAFVRNNDTDGSSKADFSENDPSIAGRGFYRRCQTLLLSEMDRPSQQALQCYIFSAVYLRNASFLNSAHSTLALAIRTAYSLGYHLDPPAHLSNTQKERQQRIWWTLYCLESKTCIAFGRPWMVQLSQVSCDLPNDDPELAKLSGPNFAFPGQGITWLSYHAQIVKLILAVRTVHLSLDNMWTQLLNANQGKSVYEDAQSLEALAEFLPQSLECVWAWLQNVPDALKTKRKGGGEPFSTDRSSLELDRVAPLWLQRQRLLLELLYHNQVMNLYRPFICFSAVPSSCTPLADSNAISCLNHAIAITNIVSKVLSETDILNGWYEAYQFQWNAALTMIAFIFAYPFCPPTPSARKAVHSAIVSFEIFRTNFAVAANAATVMREIIAMAENFSDGLFNGSAKSPAWSPTSSGPKGNNDPNMSGSDSNNIGEGLDLSGPMKLDEPPSSTGPNTLSAINGLRLPTESLLDIDWLVSDDTGLGSNLWADFTME